MRQYQKVLSWMADSLYWLMDVICAIWPILVAIAVAVFFAMAIAVDADVSVAIEEQVRACLNVGGRTVEIDGASVCLKLTQVPDAAFNGATTRQLQCSKWPNAIYTRLGRGSYECYYFEPLGAEDEKIRDDN